MILTKEKFIKAINSLKNDWDLDEQLYKCGIDITEITINGSNLFPTQMVLEILEDIYKTDIISWWCYEKYFGKDCEKYDVTDENNKDITPFTIEDLYNYCESNIEKGDN